MILCFIWSVIIIFFYRDNIFAGLQIKLGSAGTLPATKQVEPDTMSVVSLGQQSQMEPKAEKRKKRRMELLKSKLQYHKRINTSWHADISMILVLYLHQLKNK